MINKPGINIENEIKLEIIKIQRISETKFISQSLLIINLIAMFTFLFEDWLALFTIALITFIIHILIDIICFHKIDKANLRSNELYYTFLNNKLKSIRDLCLQHLDNFDIFHIDSINNLIKG